MQWETVRVTMIVTDRKHPLICLHQAHTLYNLFSVIIVCVQQKPVAQFPDDLSVGRD